MAKQTTLKVNKSFDNKLKKITEIAEEAIRDNLGNIANYAVAISPVDTGAYVESFSMLSVGQGGGRKKNSETEARRSRRVWENTASRKEFTGIALENLRQDIDKFDLERSEKVVLRNRADHAQDVEDKWGYSVFTKVRNKFGG
jgi:hypothetical protein